MIPSKTNKPRSLSVKETAAQLNLPDAKSLFKIRAACRSGALPCNFPKIRQGKLIVSEVDAFKIELDTLIAQAGKNQPTSSSPLDRRANINRRQR